MAFDFHPFLCASDEKDLIDDRLEGLDADAVYEICKAASEPLNTRFFGALRLPPAYGTQLIDSIVFDRSDLLWTQLHKLIPPSDTPQLRATLRCYIEECDEAFQVAALHILAKLGDESVQNIAEVILASTNGRHVLAVACLRSLGTDDAYNVLRCYWANETHPLSIRIAAADSLLRKGELEPLPFLIETAEDDKTEAAYYSMIAILNHHDKDLGFKLMHRILSGDTHEAQHITLRHVANMMRDWSLANGPEGLKLARDWVAKQYGAR